MIMKIFKSLLAKLRGMEYKQVIIMRQDLNLPKGKMAAQAAHAAVEAAHKSDKEKVKHWRDAGQKKVVLKVKVDTQVKVGEAWNKLSTMHSRLKLLFKNNQKIYLVWNKEISITWASKTLETLHSCRHPLHKSILNSSQNIRT